MDKLIFLSLIAGSTFNLAIEDILNNKTIPKPSFIAHFFLIIIYLSLFYPLLVPVFIAVSLILLVLNSKGIYEIGLGDVVLFIVFLEFNGFLFFFTMIPYVLVLAYEYRKSGSRSAAMLPWLALYLISFIVCALLL